MKARDIFYSCIWFSCPILAFGVVGWGLLYKKSQELLATKENYIYINEATSSSTPSYTYEIAPTKPATQEPRDFHYADYDYYTPLQLSQRETLSVARSRSYEPRKTVNDYERAYSYGNTTQNGGYVVETVVERYTVPVNGYYYEPVYYYECYETVPVLDLGIVTIELPDW